MNRKNFLSDRKSKVKFIFNFFIYIIHFLLIIFSVISHDWLTLYIGITAFVPIIISDKNRISVPASTSIEILLLIFTVHYMGELYSYYYKFWWWHTILYGLVGLSFGLVGFQFIYVFNHKKNNHIILGKVFILLFIFQFSLSMGVIWQSIQFLCDEFLFLNMQKSGLMGTMWALIGCSIGGILSASYYLLYKKIIIYRAHFRILRELLINKLDKIECEKILSNNENDKDDLSI